MVAEPLMSYRRILKRLPWFGLWPCVLRNMYLILLIVTAPHWFQLSCVRKSKQSNGEIHIENSQSPSTRVSSPGSSQCQLTLLKGNQIDPLSFSIVFMESYLERLLMTQGQWHIIEIAQHSKGWGRIAGSRPAWTTGCGPFLKGRKKEERSEGREEWVGDGGRETGREGFWFVQKKPIENSDNVLLGKLTVKLHRYYVIHILSRKRM